MRPDDDVRLPTVQIAHTLVASAGTFSALCPSVRDSVEASYLPLATFFLYSAP